MQKGRIEILDSFRFLAIMAVILMHYTYRWTPPAFPENLYPYGDFFGTAFFYGYLGVQFFFIISGFVISYTLETSSGLTSFLKKRFIRLFPPMLLCSVVTFFLCTLFDDKRVFGSAHEVRNFLPSLTFTNPSLWSTLTHRPFSYVSLSYWSLWVEVQFYFVAGILFFFNKKYFFRNLVFVTVLLNLFNYIPDRYIDPNTYDHLPEWLDLFLSRWYYNRGHFDLKYAISWFTIGVTFHHLYTNRKIQLRSLATMGVLFIFINQFFVDNNPAIKIAYLIMLTLFGCMLYRRKLLGFLDNPFFRRIGMISYSLYLIHDIAGVMFIDKLGGYLGQWSPIAPLLATALMIGFAELSFRFYEKKASALLKKLLRKPQPKQIDVPVREAVSY